MKPLQLQRLNLLKERLSKVKPTRTMRVSIVVNGLVADYRDCLVSAGIRHSLYIDTKRFHRDAIVEVRVDV